MTVRLRPFVVSAFVFLICLSSTVALAASHSNVSLPVTFEENRGHVKESEIWGICVSSQIFSTKENKAETKWRSNSLSNRSYPFGERIKVGEGRRAIPLSLT
jgi:hypothetical protein